MNKVHKMDAVVVGGGIAGIVAALLLSQRRTNRVLLIESGSELGGLLSSRHKEQWGHFDHGTHVLSETGNVELDNLLFAGVRGGSEWVGHKQLIQEVVIAGSRRISPFFDVRMLPADLHDKAYKELLSLTPTEVQFTDLESKVTRTFGPTLRDFVFRPVMEKMFGMPLNQLGTDAQNLIGLKRLVIGTEDETISLKAASRWNDDRLAYHDAMQGAAKAIHFYPRRQGIGLWVQQARQRLEESGVEIHTGARIERLDVDGGLVTGLKLEGVGLLQCGELVWSAPTTPLLRLAGISVPSGIPAPAYRCMQLTDMVLSKPLESHSHYITVYDNKFKIFRITNYAALRKKQNAGHTCVTTEVMTDSATSHGVEDLLHELVAMQLVPPNTKVLAAWSKTVDRGFPVIAPGTAQNARALADTASNSLRNLKLIGRASGRAFFMKEVLLDTYQRVDEGQAFRGRKSICR